MNGRNDDTDMPALDTRIASVLGYWDQLRGNRVAPGRVEIRPGAITSHLSRICVLERPRAGTLRLRLAGATMSERMGMELRGMPFRAMFHLDHRNVAMDAAETAISTPAVSILSLGHMDSTGPVPEAALAILPLTDTRGALTRAITVYSELAQATRFASDIRSKFVVQDSWTFEIPETGPLPAAGNYKATPRLISQRILRPRKAQLDVMAEADGMEAQDAPRTRPVFRVIDGGLA